MHGGPGHGIQGAGSGPMVCLGTVKGWWWLKGSLTLTLGAKDNDLHVPLTEATCVSCDLRVPVFNNKAGFVKE